jgi:hypothetical protein
MTTQALTGERADLLRSLARGSLGAASPAGPCAGCAKPYLADLCRLNELSGVA